MYAPAINDIVRLSGVGRVAISRLLSGKPIRRDTAERVAAIFSLDPGFVMFGPRHEVRARIIAQAALMEVDNANQHPKRATDQHLQERA